MGSTIAHSPAGYSAAIFAAPHGTPYSEHDNRIHAGTAAALRDALHNDFAWFENWNFDFEGVLLGEQGFQPGRSG